MEWTSDKIQINKPKTNKNLLARMFHMYMGDTQKMSNSARGDFELQFWGHLQSENCHTQEDGNLEKNIWLINAICEVR